MVKEVPLTLREIQNKLRTDQHVLIHLCEKGVVIPDEQDTAGRGKWRKFSQRNLFEFAVALALRKYQIPISIVAACIRLLRAFERSTRRIIEGFELLDAIAHQQVGINLYLFDGEYVVFELSKHEVLLGFDITKVLDAPTKQVKIDKLTELPKPFGSYLKLDLFETAKSIL